MKQKTALIWKIIARKICKSGLVGLLILVFCNLSCSDQVKTREKKSQGLESWRQSIIKSRQEKDETFKNSPTSPMAGVKRLEVKPGQVTFEIKNMRDVFLSSEKVQGAQFSLMNHEGKWTWNSIHAAVACRGDEKPLKPGSQLPDYAAFHMGDFTLAAYPSTQGLILLVFDSERPELKNFSHLRYFQPDPSFAPEARLEIYPRFTRVTMLTSRNLEKTFYRYARVLFEIKGHPLALTAFKISLGGPGSDILFIPFKDSTNSKETYGGGRFLEIPDPKAETFVLDFNRCFNPLCNYSPAYNCPLPPMENILDVPVRVGEQTYPHDPLK